MDFADFCINNSVFMYQNHAFKKFYQQGKNKFAQKNCAFKMYQSLKKRYFDKETQISLIIRKVITYEKKEGKCLFKKKNLGGKFIFQ